MIIKRNGWTEVIKKTCMTLKEIITLRKHKYDESIQASKSDYWTGYQEGWRQAYGDLEEILEQRGFLSEEIIL